MISTKEKDGPFDVIIVSGDAYVDHPSFGTAVIARVLESKGYSVGIIAQPDWRSKTDFMKLGKPGLYFGITAGNMDSMVANYTPLKKPREYDAYTRDGIIGKRPDMATIVYCNRLRECFKDVPLVIGGIEASLRRLAHYDYWKNSVRKSLLFDAKADVLVYGMGEHAVVELAKFYEDHTKKDTPLGIMNTCVKLKTAPEGHIVIPSFGEVEHDKKKFCEAFVLYSKNQKIAQQHTDWFLVQYPMHVMDEKEIDAVYDLPYSRKEGYHEKIPAFMTTRFSVVTHRGCFGNCSFCALALHQGKIIQSRSERSIIEEIQKITKLEGYRGTIDDMGGPSADMYGMDCSTPCGNDCISCEKRKKDRAKLISLLTVAKKVPDVRNVFVSSGIRYDLAMESPEYIRKIVRDHVPGRIKVAPEHVSGKVLSLMKKPTIDCYEKFLSFVSEIDTTTEILPYFMAAHPGCDIREMRELMAFVEKHGEAEQCQLFTPTPMTRSTCMYWTGMVPETGEEIYVPYTYHEKKLQKAMMVPSQNEDRLKELDFDTGM